MAAFNYLPGIEFVLLRQDDLYIAGTGFEKLDLTAPRPRESSYRERPYWAPPEPLITKSSINFTVMAVSNDFEACMNAAKKWQDCNGQEGTYYVWIPREGVVSDPDPIINQGERVITHVSGPKRLAPPQV